MEDQFVTFEIALKLKELGFNENTICGYNSSKVLTSKVSYAVGFNCECKWDNKHDVDIKAPLWQQVIDWLREKHDIHVHVNPFTNPAKGIHIIKFEYCISTKENNYEGAFRNSIERLTKKITTLYLLDTHKKALEKGISEALKLI